MALRCALALALLAQALFLLAAIGQLRPVPIVAVVACCLLPVARGVRPATGNWQLATFFALLIPLALFPPLAFDETLYHLPFIRALATSGHLQFLTDMRWPVFPQLQELLCVPVFLLAGDTATHLVSLVEMLILAALLFERSRLAAALFLGSPIVLHLATITHVDAALALFVTAGFYCLDRRQIALSGLFFGTACSVKYLGGYFALAAFAIAIVAYHWRAALTFAATCVAAMLPTTLWLILETHNPVFPFFRSSAWSMALPQVAFGTRVVRTLRLVWDVTFARERVNFQPPVTPLLALMVVAVLALAIRDIRARIVVFICAGYLVAFSFLPQDSRYLVPLLPLISFTAARWPKAPAWLAWIAIAPGVFYIGYRLALQGLPPADREAYLTSRVPEYRALQRTGNDRVYVCGGEQLKYYARGQLLGDFVGPYSYERVLTGDVAENLRRIDAHYYLVAKRVCLPPRAEAGMDLVYEDAAAQLWRIGGPPVRRRRTSGPAPWLRTLQSRPTGGRPTADQRSALRAPNRRRRRCGSGARLRRERPDMGCRRAARDRTCRRG